MKDSVWLIALRVVVNAMSWVVGVWAVWHYSCWQVACGVLILLWITYKDAKRGTLIEVSKIFSNTKL